MVFVIPNGTRRNGRRDADETANKEINGDTLSAERRRNVDSQTPAAVEKLAADGHDFAEASPEPIAVDDGVVDTMVAAWTVAAKAAGVVDPAAMLVLRNDTQASLAGD